MTESGRTGWRSRKWLLIGIVGLLVIGTVFFVLHGRDNRADPKVTATRPSTPSSSAAGPLCLPKVTEIGYTVDRFGEISFGLIATSDCPQAAVNTSIEVTAIGKSGKVLVTDYVSSIGVPVLLPGQRVGLGGTLIVEGPVARLQTRVLNTKNITATAFPSWPRSVRITNIQHSATDSSGNTLVSGTLVTDPSSVTLCSPTFYLVLRNHNDKIIFGNSTWKTGPTFKERLPSGVDWSRAEIFVVLGRATGLPTAAHLSCH